MPSKTKNVGFGLTVTTEAELDESGVFSAGTSDKALAMAMAVSSPQSSSGNFNKENSAGLFCPESLEIFGASVFEDSPDEGLSEVLICVDHSQLQKNVLPQSKMVNNLVGLLMIKGIWRVVTLVLG